MLAALVVTAGGAAYITSRPSGDLTTGSTTARLTVAEYQSRVQACGGGEGTADAFSSPAGRACLDKVAFSAVDSGGLDAYQKALEAQTALTPGLWATCHTSGHAAGLYAYDKTKDIIALLKMNPSAACQYGIGHGILEGFAFDPAMNDDIFRQAAKICDTMREIDPEVFYLCSDGLGHAAWSSTYDFSKAVKRCSTNPESLGRVSCGEAIVMQIYDAIGDESRGEVANAPAEMPTRCEAISLPDVALQRDARFGCNRGAAYVYARGIWKTYDDWVYTRGDNVPYDAEFSARMTSDFKAAVGMCRNHLSAGSVRECFTGLITQVPPNVYLGKELLNAVCGLFGDQKQECILFGKHWNNTPLANDGTRSIEATPGPEQPAPSIPAVTRPEV